MNNTCRTIMLLVKLLQKLSTYTIDQSNVPFGGSLGRDRQAGHLRFNAQAPFLN